MKPDNTIYYPNTYTIYLTQVNVKYSIYLSNFLVNIYLYFCHAAMLLCTCRKYNVVVQIAI